MSIARRLGSRVTQTIMGRPWRSPTASSTANSRASWARRSGAESVPPRIGSGSGARSAIAASARAKVAHLPGRSDEHEPQLGHVAPLLGRVQHDIQRLRRAEIVPQPRLDPPRLQHRPRYSAMRDRACLVRAGPQPFGHERLQGLFRQFSHVVHLRCRPHPITREYCRASSTDCSAACHAACATPPRSDAGSRADRSPRR